MWIEEAEYRETDEEETYFVRFMTGRENLRYRLEQGESREVLIEELQRRFELAKTEQDEDMALDLQDCLTGWCAPHMKL